MPLEMVVLIAAVLVSAFLVAAIISVVRRQGEKCLQCGKRLPRGASLSTLGRCPACDQDPLGHDTPSGRPRGIRPSSAPSTLSSASLPILSATQGPLAQQRFTLSSQGLTIGRHPDNDIVLMNELMVSRFHAVVALEEGQYVLYDRDSANGTWVNESRVFRHVLVPGDRIAIWNSLFVYGTADTPSPPPPPAIASQPTIHVVGERFCGYYLENLIGRGGMSEVFRARDGCGREVAIKILHETDPYLVAKFVQEGNQIGPLLRGHANIVYVYEFGQSPDNRLYIVMEYVDAPSLRKILRQPMCEMDTVKIMGQVCCALGFAHQNDVVHRDVKPENILITADGRAKVLDFGIAKLTSAATITRDKIVGTPEYISPEQVRGEPVQPASDVYALGVVLYELLTGSVPFMRPRVESLHQGAFEVIRQHLEQVPEPMRRRNPNAQISPQMEQITMRALSKDPRSRYATAKEMGQALGCREPADQPDMPIRPTGASMLVLRGPRRGERIAISDQPLILGRSGLGSSNPTISRRHAQISWRGGSFWLQDTSKNGTWVDNLRVYGEAPLVDGSVIVIGDNMLRLEHMR